MRFDDKLEIERALVIYAHPDDAEFGCSGTVAKWAKAGVEVTYCLVTNGASGSQDPSMTREQLAEIRRNEQLEAAAILGVSHVEFLGFEDGFLEVNYESRKQVTRVVRTYKPDVLIATDPTIRFSESYINHPDHIAAGDLAMRSVNPDASTRMMFPELNLEPHKPKAVFVVQFGPGTNHVEDISDTLEQKLQALAAHSSQIGNPDEIAEFVRERSHQVGEPLGIAHGEGFRIVRL
ncbi:MAG: PIG-L deacetylase family protein [Actinomycetota bacterium]